MTLQDENHPLALFAARDPLPTYTLLALLSAVAILTLLAALVDLAASGRRTRLILDGDATINSATIQLKRNTSQSLKRNSSSTILSKQSTRPSNLSASALGGAPHPPSTSFARHDNIFDEDITNDALYSDLPLSINNNDRFKNQQQQHHHQQQMIHQNSNNSSTSNNIGRRRRFICISIVRIILAAAIIASTVPGVGLGIKYFSTNSLISLASDETNQWIHSVMKRSILDYVAGDLNRIPLVDKSTDIGIGPSVLSPSDTNATSKIRWGTVLLVSFVVSIIGTIMAVAGRFVPGKRIIAYIIFAQAFIWLLVSLAAAYIHSDIFPLDASPLQNKWLDRIYADRPRELNATRLLANWYISVPSAKFAIDTKEEKSKIASFPILNLPGFEESFCRQFNKLLPNSAAVVPQDPEKVDNPRPRPVDKTKPTNTPTPADNPPTEEEPVEEEEKEEEPEEEEEEEEEEEKEKKPAKKERPSQEGSDSDSKDDEPASEPDSVSDDSVDEDDRPSAPVRVIIQKADQVHNISSSIPKVPPPESLKIKRLSRSLVSEVIIVYLVGKPIGPDQYRALAYMTLPAIIGAPVAIAHMFTSYLLYPFVAVWLGIMLVFTLIATPNVLRPVAAPKTLNQVINVCGIRYRILVADPKTNMIARLDVAIFAIIVFIAVVQGFRWLRIAETSAERAEEKEIKLVNYEEVYSGSGQLRW